MSQIQCFRMGIDLAKGPDQSAYWCNRHGSSKEPCECLKAFLRTNAKEADKAKQARNEKAWDRIREALSK